MERKMDWAILIISTVSVFVAIISVWLVIRFRNKDKKNKEINFLYKRLREYKSWCNNFVMTTLEERRVFNEGLGSTAPILFDTHVEFQDITNAKVLLLDTIMTSKILNYKAIASDLVPWVPIKYQKNISKKVIDILNEFGNELFNIAIRRNKMSGISYWKGDSNFKLLNDIKNDFLNHINGFVYMKFHEIIKEII